jgi:uncharacterized damage-inducible protein DinB
MTIDPPTRTEAPLVATERPMLDGWLEYHRATLLMKCAGLDDAGLTTRSAPPSPMSLLGLVRHMTEVERGWFRRRVGGEKVAPLYYSDADPEGDFDVDGADVTADLAAYRDELDACRAVTAQHQDLDATVSGRTQAGEAISLRWIYLHMIEETARHTGQVDILREQLDGATGFDG